MAIIYEIILDVNHELLHDLFIWQDVLQKFISTYKYIINYCVQPASYI